MTTTNFMQQVGVSHCFICHLNHDDIRVHYNSTATIASAPTQCSIECKMYDGTPVLKEEKECCEKCEDLNLCRCTSCDGKCLGCQECHTMLCSHCECHEKVNLSAEICPCPFHTLMYKCPLFEEEKIE